MSYPKSILIQSNFLYHMRHREIVLNWFTDRAILKFVELVISTIALVFSIQPSEITHSFEFLLLCCTTVNWTVCLVLYAAHFLECQAPPYVDAAFSVLAVAAGLVCFLFDVLSESTHQLTAILFSGVVIHMIELTCIMWMGNHKNFLYRYFSRKKRPAGEVPTPKELRKKGVKFSTAPDTYREPSIVEDSDEDDDEYDYRRKIDYDDEKYFPVQF